MQRLIKTRNRDIKNRISRKCETVIQPVLVAMVTKAGVKSLRPKLNPRVLLQLHLSVLATSKVKPVFMRPLNNH